MRSCDDAFEALADETNLDWRELTPSARGWLNGALRQIRSAAGDLNGQLPAEIRLRAERYRRAY
ncbi:MAG: hypothetical protein ACT4PO_06165, partial [Actinomycetota bacterium]